MIHIPVLQREVLEYLDPKPNENFIDATIGQGGHTSAILEKTAPNGKILGIDWSEEILKNTRYIIQDAKYKDRVVLVCDSFVNLKEIIKKQGFRNISGILFDLGMSSWHLEESERGFSFLRKEPLDMRYSLQNPLTPLEVNGTKQKHKENKPLTGLTAEKILNYYSGDGIEKILREFGDERFSRKISEKIIETRKIKPIKNTFQLIEIIKRATPSWYHRSKINPATRTFQALRIAVNNELNNLQEVLPRALEVLEKEGRLAIISFHSLEDRIVKNFYRSRTSIDLKILTKKPIQPTSEEVKINPRSRSAKLRAAIKTCPIQ